MRRKTKIVATISSKNCSVPFIRGLFEAGMNVVRLNTAHMNHDDALEGIRNTRFVSDTIGILLDTKGRRSGPVKRICLYLSNMVMLFCLRVHQMNYLMTI